VFPGKYHDKVALMTTLETKNRGSCIQSDILFPRKHSELWNNISVTVLSDNFKSKAVDWLSHAVQIP